MFEIVEKFISIGGEAPISGQPVFLIRFSGCNLNCTYCDTIYHTEKNEILSKADLTRQIKKQIKQQPHLKVLFTGGEPLMGERQDQLMSVINDCPMADFYIETNGSIPIHCFDMPHCHYVMDWKTPSSGHEHSFLLDNLRALAPEKDCIKIVLCPADLEWVLKTVALIREIQPGLPLFLSPQWDNMPPVELADFILSHQLPCTLQVQLHKIIWENEKRGV